MEPLPQTESTNKILPVTQQQPIAHPIDWKYQVQQYGAAAMVAAPVFVLFSVYIFYRRGYYDLYIMNKVFAGDAAVLLGFVLLLGPLSRMFNRFDRYVQYRKELGVLAFFLALLHSVSSFCFLPHKFPMTLFFHKQLWPFVFGLAGTILLTALFLSSREKIKAKLGSHRWWKFQNWGVRFVLVFTALHVGIMKIPGWIDWYKNGGTSDLVHPEWPGAGLLVGWFLAFVILVRLAEPLDKQWGKLAWYAGVILLPTVYLVTFIWGYQFVK